MQLLVHVYDYKIGAVRRGRLKAALIRDRRDATDSLSSVTKVVVSCRTLKIIRSVIHMKNKDRRRRVLMVSNQVCFIPCRIIFYVSAFYISKKVDPVK